MNQVKNVGTETIQNTNMTCPNCGENHWKSVDRYRIKPAQMGLCMSCGFVSYPTKWKSYEEIKKHYRSAYRNPPTHQNYFAGERKNHFHHKFLYDLFELWREQGVESPKVLEVGAAYGVTLRWIKQLFPKAEIYGTELTTSFRRNAYHEFGITLSEEIDETKSYDLIITYKVLEHQLDPDKELQKYTRLLTPTGKLYISVPTWFNSAINFGLGGFDLEYYYDPNHINVWSREIFENILERSGFKILENNQTIYASTYLCGACPDNKSLEVFKHDPNDIEQAMLKIKTAYQLVADNKYDQAIELWSDYPQAWVSRAEMNRKQMAEKGWAFFAQNFLEPAMKACPTSAEVFIMSADFALRAEQYQAAIKLTETALEMKPENPIALNLLGNIMREMALKAKNTNEKLHYFAQAREVMRHLRNVSAQHFKEATDLIYFLNAQIPFEEEIKKAEPSTQKPVAQPSRPLEAAI